MSEYEYTLGSEVVHTVWKSDLEPVLKVEPGSKVRLFTRDGFDSQINSPVTGGMIDSRLYEVIDFSRVAPLTGPIYVETAEPGDVLEVEILELIPRGEGSVLVFPVWHQADFIPAEYRSQFPNAHIKHFDMDNAVANGFVEFGQGIRVDLNPMLGMIGTAPAHGQFTTPAPREFGGNMDAKVICKGSTVYLPVFVPGALLSMGDGHAAQGDGEICTTAVECPMEVVFRVNVRKGHSISGPWVETEDKYISMGIGRTLDEATKKAICDMIDFLVQAKPISHYEAYALVSLAGDLRINQIVDWPHLGVRLELPKKVFRNHEPGHQSVKREESKQ